MTTNEALKWLKRCANTDCDDCEHNEKPFEYCDSMMAECVEVLEEALEKING